MARAELGVFAMLVADKDEAARRFYQHSVRAENWKARKVALESECFLRTKIRPLTESTDR